MMVGYLPIDDTLTNYYRRSGRADRGAPSLQMTCPSILVSGSSLRIRITKCLCLIIVPTVILQIYFLSISGPYSSDTVSVTDKAAAMKVYIEQTDLERFQGLPADMIRRYIEARIANLTQEELPAPQNYQEFVTYALEKHNETLKNANKSSVTFMWEVDPSQKQDRRTTIKTAHKVWDDNDLEWNDINKDNSVTDVPTNEHGIKRTPRNETRFDLIKKQGRLHQFNSSYNGSSKGNLIDKRHSSAAKDHQFPTVPLGKTTTPQIDNRPSCPLEYNTTTCSFAFIADATVKASVYPEKRVTQARELVKRGMILINGKIVHEFATRDFNLFMVRVNEKCEVVQKLKLKSIIRRTRDLYTADASQYIKALPDKTLVAGIAFGTSDLVFRNHFTRTHVRTTMTISRTTRTLRDVQVTSFVSFKGFPGLSTKHVATGKDYHLFETHFSFGHPFDKAVSNQSKHQVIENHRDVSIGGFWKPTSCKPRSRIAIIVPFRNREKHLYIFLDNLMKFLKMQLIEFQIFIVEQTGPELFNRASLMNIGYLEALEGNFDCYVFHDVDQIPEDLANWYHCGPEPRHLMATRSYTGYSLKFDAYFGGAISLTSDLIEQINGFPNRMFGWGGEDDEMYGRLEHLNYTLQRLPLEIGRYTSLQHPKFEDHNPHIKLQNGTTLRKEAAIAMETDGLDSLNVTDITRHDEELFAHIMVRINGPKTVKEATRIRKGVEKETALTSAESSHPPITTLITLLVCFVKLIA